MGYKVESAPRFELNSGECATFYATKWSARHFLGSKVAYGLENASGDAGEKRCLVLPCELGERFVVEHVLLDDRVLDVCPEPRVRKVGLPKKRRVRHILEPNSGECATVWAKQVESAPLLGATKWRVG